MIIAQAGAIHNINKQVVVDKENGKEHISPL